MRWESGDNVSGKFKMIVVLLVRDHEKVHRDVLWAVFGVDEASP
jgi:hypothetical protein